MTDDNWQNQRRERTRQALLDATRTLVSERGHDKIAVSDITERASVATGTFYYYFTSKQCSFEAVRDEIRHRFNQRLTEIRSQIADPALRLATSLRYSFVEAQNNEEWTTFLIYSGLNSDDHILQDEQLLLADIEAGVNGGRFQVEDLHFTQTLIVGMVKHINHEMGAGRLGPSAIEHATKSILKMLGISEIVTTGLIQAPLPPVAAPKRTDSTEAGTKEETAPNVVAFNRIA
jgi:AcrR family transcriptional regulator